MLNPSALEELERQILIERERCAKIVEGIVYHHRYRTWPWWGTGNLANESEMVKFCDAAAAEIRKP